MTWSGTGPPLRHSWPNLSSESQITESRSPHRQNHRIAPHPLRRIRLKPGLRPLAADDAGSSGRRACWAERSPWCTTTRRRGSREPPPDDLQKQVHDLTRAGRAAQARPGNAGDGAEPLPQFHRIHLRRLSGWLSQRASGDSRARFGHWISRRQTACSPPTVTSPNPGMEMRRPKHLSAAEPPPCSRAW